MTDDTVRAQTHQLWAANFLNIRRATEEARTQARTRLDIGFELQDITLTAAGDFPPFAAVCLSFVSRNSFLGFTYRHWPMPTR